MVVSSRKTQSPSRHPGLASVLFLCGVLGVTAQVPDGFVDAVKRDTEWLAQFPSRVVGSEGHRRARENMRQRIESLGPAKVWTQTFGTVVPVVEDAQLVVEGGVAEGTHRVYPMWPASSRLNTTPAEGIAGTLVYVHEAEPQDLPAHSLRGQIAVLDSSAGRRWISAANAGARAILCLGSEQEAQLDLQPHVLPMPINVPRFYVLPGPLADALRQGEGVTGRLVARAAWRDAEATNIYALIAPRPEGKGRRALAVAATLDATGIVPELAPGADAALDAALALNLMRALVTTPPERPVLFVFLDAQGINQLGVRHMLSALAVPRDDKELETLSKEDHELWEEYHDHWECALDLSCETTPLDALCREQFRDLHRYVKDEVAREVIVIETEMHPKRLKLYSAEGGIRDGLAKEVALLSERRSKFLAAQEQLLTKKPLQESIRELGQALWDRAHARVAGQLAEVEQRLAAVGERDKLRTELLAALGTDEDVDRPLAFLLGLDLSDAGTGVGPALYCRFLAFNESRNATDFTRWLSDVTKDGPEVIWPPELHPAVSLSPLSGLDSPDSYSVGDQGTLTSPAQSFGTAAVTWTTLDGLRTRVDTPWDRADRLDWSRLEPQVRATALLVSRMANDASFEPETKIVPKWRRIWGTLVDQSAGEPVPRLPMKGYLTTLVSGGARSGRGGVRFLAASTGIRRQQFVHTGTDGRFYFDAMPSHVGWVARSFFVQSHLLAEDGSILRSVDLKKEGKGVTLNIDVRTHNPTPLRAVAFTCREMQGFDFFDSRFLVSLPTATVLDARRGGEPRRLNYSLSGGLLTCQLEHELRWQLILRAGVTRNRMALINMMPPETSRGVPTREAMQGFEVGEALPVHPLYQSALDLFRLDGRRLRDYESAGITSRAIAELRERTQGFLAEAETAIREDDGGKLYRNAHGALSNEIRTYQAVRDMANDVIRAAIFLLLALAPFSFALERLLIASPYIYRQIAGMAGIFAVMTSILWSFHPAFRISNQPLMIVMAFGIILMSLLVLSVVFSRFESGLEEMRSGRAEASGARTSRVGVLTTAVRLGIANMRKRKLRTALTGTTIMLITFALLCFTSTSRYVGHKEFTVDAEAPYDGVLVRQPSNRAMPLEALTYLDQAVGRTRVGVPRFWWLNQWEPQWRVHVRNPQTGKEKSLHAALGLDPAEGELTTVRTFLPDWDRFSEHGGCYLAAATADELGIVPGGKVLLAGKELELVGVFESSRVDQELRDLDGEKLMPADYSAVGDEQRRLLARGDLEMLAVEMESGAGLEPDADLPRIPSTSVIIVPADMLSSLRESTLRSVAVKTESATEAKALGMELVKRLAFPIYFSSPDGVRVAATTPLLPRAPKSLLIPLIIAGFIIFNTMLSSIAERKREIYIYTSLGLAPIHVGFLFLAEAVTYGLMGSIFGYIVGQGLATVFSKLGWMGSITLNYSGTQTIAVMVLVLAVVVLSSLVPAYLAGRLAAPSNERSWAVPEPVDDVIRDTLPFTATNRTANGVVTFLLEYLDAHREGSIGNFSTDNLRPLRLDVDGLELLGIEGTVWLAPYDLGVRQDVRVLVRPTGEEDVIGIDIELRRESGQVRSWHKLNRVFLGDLRKQLLGWRRLKPERILRYIADAGEKMAQARA